jgi:endoglucanase
MRVSTLVQFGRRSLLLGALVAAGCINRGGSSDASKKSTSPLTAEESGGSGRRGRPIEIVKAPNMLRGINLAGAEFAEDSLPGKHGDEYCYPDAKYKEGYKSPAYFVQKGMNVFRLPFRWERLQPQRNEPFDKEELERLQTTVKNLKGLGAKVILDPHNYARYKQDIIGSAAVPNRDFNDFWSRLATLYKNDDTIIFGLMNEPKEMKTEQWRDSANEAIVAIRKTGAKNLILVPGNGWTGAHSWMQDWYGTANGEVMLTISDPANNYAFEVHQYMDKDSSGSGDECVSETIGAERMKVFTDWAKKNGKRGFLGEFNGGDNPQCEVATQNMLNHIESNPDVYIGWTWWAAGPVWGSGSKRVIEPKDGRDPNQMRWLERRLK